MRGAKRALLRPSCNVHVYVCHTPAVLALSNLQLLDQTASGKECCSVQTVLEKSVAWPPPAPGDCGDTRPKGCLVRPTRTSCHSGAATRTSTNLSRRSHGHDLRPRGRPLPDDELAHTPHTEGRQTMRHEQVEETRQHRSRSARAHRTAPMSERMGRLRIPHTSDRRARETVHPAAHVDHHAAVHHTARDPIPAQPPILPTMIPPTLEDMKREESSTSRTRLVAYTDQGGSAREGDPAPLHTSGLCRLNPFPAAT